MARPAIRITLIDRLGKRSFPKLKKLPKLTLTLLPEH